MVIFAIIMQHEGPPPSFCRINTTLTYVLLVAIAADCTCALAAVEHVAVGGVRRLPGQLHVEAQHYRINQRGR